jgi:hypothetical protein
MLRELLLSSSQVTCCYGPQLVYGNLCNPVTGRCQGRNITPPTPPLGKLDLKLSERSYRGIR